jgi:hypothetical protein
MALRLSGFCVLALILTAPAAQAFTMVDPNGTDAAGAVPKFDLEDQTRHFRTGEASGAGAAIREFKTPLGNGKVQFGIQNDNRLFGSSGFRAQEDRRHMDRMLSAPGLQHRYDR